MPPLPRLFLKAGREKSLLRRHPWVFSGAVDRLEGEAESGADIIVCSHSGTELAVAAWSPVSQIRARIWSFDPREVIDRSFFKGRIRQAAGLRRLLGFDDPQGGCRLIFSEGDNLPGVIVDRYADWLVAQFTSAGAEFHREEIADALMEVTGCRGIVERSDVSVRSREGLPERTGICRGAAIPGKIIINEEGGRFETDPCHGQKTGFYFDLRTARREIRKFSAGRRVLNCFCYTGGFAVAALQGGAAEVLSLDSSAPALQCAARNIELNAIPAGKAAFRRCDVFTELRKLREAGEKFDLVILDPPKLVDSMGALRRGCRAYQDLARLGFSLLSPGGILVNFSCSGLMEPSLFQKITSDAAIDAGCFSARMIGKLNQSPDHPVSLAAPESFYLKGLITAI